MQKYARSLSSSDDESGMETKSTDGTEASEEFSEEASDSFEEEEDINDILKDIRIDGRNKKIVKIKSDIVDIIEQEENENLSDFTTRKTLTIKIASLDHLKINNSSALVCASMLMRKSKYNITYPDDVEAALSYILALALDAVKSEM